MKAGQRHIKLKTENPQGCEVSQSKKRQKMANDSNDFLRGSPPKKHKYQEVSSNIGEDTKISEFLDKSFVTEPQLEKDFCSPETMATNSITTATTSSAKESLDRFHGIAKQREIQKLSAEYNECIGRIRQNVVEAERLANLLLKGSFENASNICASDENNVSVSKQWRSLPSSEPIWSSEDYETTLKSIKIDSTSWKKFELKNFHVDISQYNNVETVWHLWKVGTPEIPSIEFMNDTYGMFAFVSDKQEHSLYSCWAKVVQEMECHLESGRDLDEVTAVANLHLQNLGGDVRNLARSIVENMENSKTTLFEWSSSRGMQI